MRPLIIAHRGASHLAPENTLTAFRLAKTLGADGFECDVQITRDRHLVVAHDYLTDLGLAYLRGRGLGEVLLYVEEDNAAAVHLYESRGFRRFAVDVSWRRDPS